MATIYHSPLVEIPPFCQTFKTSFFLQNFLAANSQCWWNTPLTAATRALKYAGHVAPGMLLVTAEPCALEILRGAYARSVLKPPATYTISSVGECFLDFSVWQKSISNF